MENRLVFLYFSDLRLVQRFHAQRPTACRHEFDFKGFVLAMYEHNGTHVTPDQFKVGKVNEQSH